MDVLITTSSFGKNDDSPLKLLSKNNLGYVLNPFKRKITEEELANLVLEHKPKYLIAGTEKITSRALDIMKNSVKIISRCGIGTDNIDLEYAKKLDIKVKNTPDAPTKPVAELTLGVILDLLRKISYANSSIRKGEFEKPMGNLLWNKTVGLIGCGRIGSHLAKLLQPFECKIIGYDPFVKAHPLITLKSFDEVVKEADILSLHIPFSEENKHIINKSVLSEMKKSAYLLNISRGGLVCESDLVSALKNNEIKGAGLDCFEEEPYRGELINFNNVVLTSHIGSYAKEARLKQEIDSVKNILEELCQKL